MAVVLPEPDGPTTASARPSASATAPACRLTRLPAVASSAASVTRVVTA